jgi:hypothetical protein
VRLTKSELWLSKFRNVIRLCGPLICVRDHRDNASIQNPSKMSPQRSKRIQYSLQPISRPTASYCAEHQPTNLWQKRRGARFIVPIIAAARSAFAIRIALSANLDRLRNAIAKSITTIRSSQNHNPKTFARSLERRRIARLVRVSQGVSPRPICHIGAVERCGRDIKPAKAANSQ